MSYSTYSYAGIGIILQEDDERYEQMKQKMFDEYEQENGNRDEDLIFEEYFGEDTNIRYEQGGNFVCDDSYDHMFVCRGDTLQEQLDNIPSFLEAMNKYITLTTEEINVVSVYQYM